MPNHILTVGIHQDGIKVYRVLICSDALCSQIPLLVIFICLEPDILRRSDRRIPVHKHRCTKYRGSKKTFESHVFRLLCVSISRLYMCLKLKSLLNSLMKFSMFPRLQYSFTISSGESFLLVTMKVKEG